MARRRLFSLVSLVLVGNGSRKSVNARVPTIFPRIVKRSDPATDKNRLGWGLADSACYISSRDRRSGRYLDPYEGMVGMTKREEI